MTARSFRSRKRRQHKIKDAASCAGSGRAAAAPCADSVALPRLPLNLTHLGLTERALHVLAVSLIGLVLTDIIGDRFPLREKLLETVWLRYAVWVILLAVTAVCGAYGTGFNPQEFVYFQF